MLKRLKRHLKQIPAQTIGFVIETKSGSSTQRISTLAFLLSFIRYRVSRVHYKATHACVV